MAFASRQKLHFFTAFECRVSSQEKGGGGEKSVTEIPAWHEIAPDRKIGIPRDRTFIFPPFWVVATVAFFFLLERPPRYILLHATTVRKERADADADGAALKLLCSRGPKWGELEREQLERRGRSELRLLSWTTTAMPPATLFFRSVGRSGATRRLEGRGSGGGERNGLSSDRAVATTKLLIKHNR